MPDPNIVTRLLETPGFGWQCGEPLRDKGSYFRCSCGCSQPDADSDGYLAILQPKILREAAQEIERLCVERDEARKELCHEIFTNGGLRPSEYARHRGWDCYKQEDGK